MRLLVLLLLLLVFLLVHASGTHGGRLLHTVDVHGGMLLCGLLGGDRFVAPQRLLTLLDHLLLLRLLVDDAGLDCRTGRKMRIIVLLLLLRVLLLLWHRAPLYADATWATG